MTGKMLSKAEYAAVLQAADHTGGVFYYGAGGVAVATHADDGVGGVAVDIDAGGKVKVDAKATQLCTGQLARKVDVAGVAGGSQCHSAGYIDTVLGQAGHDTTLLIDHDEWIIASLSADKFCQIRAEGAQLGCIADILAEKDDVADFVLPDDLHQLRRDGCTGKTSDKPLANQNLVCHMW